MHISESYNKGKEETKETGHERMWELGFILHEIFLLV